MKPRTTPVCAQCNDTHRMTLTRDGHEDQIVMCTACPVPCSECSTKPGFGPFCAVTPCSCVCHVRPRPWGKGSHSEAARAHDREIPVRFLEAGAAIAFGLMGMAFAIQATHNPSRHCDCGAIYSGPNAHPTMCFSCIEEQTPEWQAWAKAAGVSPRRPSPAKPEPHDFHAGDEGRGWDRDIA